MRNYKLASNAAELIDLIHEVGFLPLLSSGIVGFSAEQLVDEGIAPVDVSEITNGISHLKENENMRNGGNEKWTYDLQGRRIEGRPTKRGLYISGGKLIVVP